MATTDTLVINRIFSKAAERKATDLHFVTGNYPTMRIAGKLVSIADEEIVNPDFINYLVKHLLSKEKYQQWQEDKDITTIFDWMGQLRLKVKVYQQKGLPAVSIHLISEVIPDLNDLNLPRSVNNFLQFKKGLIVIGGTFSSGRSTTAAAMVNAINNTRSERILTIENPIEYLLVNNNSVVVQQEVGSDIDSISEGLELAFDQDYNTILVTQVPTWQDWHYIMKHCEAGRLVIVVMTAETSTAAIQRIIKSYPEDKQEWVRELLANNLKGILIQRLLPRVGGGLVPAAEVLFINQAINASIKENKLYQLFTVLQTNRDSGMISLDNSIVELIKNGEVTQTDAAKEIIDKDKLRIH